MRQDTDNDSQSSGDAVHADKTVATLMNLAGPRADVPGDIENRVRSNVHRHWRRSTTRRATLRWAVPASLAATVLIAFAFNFQTPDAPMQSVGTIAKVLGSDTRTNVRFSVGDTLYAGENLETGAYVGISILLAGDVSLRIGPASSLRFDNRDEITLQHGRIYADSGERNYRDHHLTVHTTMGSATDIGTQFSVTLMGDQMDVAVREGRVNISRDKGTLTADAGDRLILQADTDVVIEQISANDPSWSWATSLAPEFDIADRTLMEFLTWAARESGRVLIFADDEVRMSAMRAKLGGSSRVSASQEDIESIFSTTSFEYAIDQSRITVRK